MNPTPLADLSEFSHGFPVQCVEAILSALYPAKEGVSQKSGKPYFMQDGELRDDSGFTHKVLFNDKECGDMVAGWRNKRIRIACQMVKGKPSGLSMDENLYNGKTTRRLRVTRAAIISLASGASEPQDRPQAQTGPHDAARTSPMQSTAIQTVSEKVRDWFGVYAVVCQGYDQFLQDTLEKRELAPEQLKDIATTIFLSYKEGYINKPPFFGEPHNGLDAQGRIEDQDEPF